MAFPILAIIQAVPSILAAYKTVKEVNKEPSKLINRNLAAEGKAGLSAEYLKTIPSQDLNNLKRQVAIDLLRPVLLERLKSRGCNEDDLGVIIDFACVVYKLVRGKK